MTSAATRSIVSALRFESGLAVIDVGTHLDEPRATALEFADRVLLVTTPDLPALRSARRSLAQWDRLAIRSPASVELVLNRRTSRDEVTPALVERIVERPVAFTVPDGGPVFAGAVNTATLLETPTAVHAAVAKAGAVALWPETTPAQEGTPDGPTEVEALVTGSARRTGRRKGADRQRTSRRRAGRAAADPEAGQSTVELPVVILMALTAFLLCVQGVGWATGLLAARAAAQEGARTVGILGYYDAVGDPRAEVVEQARDDVRARLPDSMRDVVGDSDIEVSPDTVSVRVTVSTILPGVDLSASSSAAVYREG
jgi:hypothetical protein